MKNNVVSCVGGGIKCDNPKCDYCDLTVKIEEYKSWINKPCPKCGNNLLTKQDYKNVQTILRLAQMVNANEVDTTTSEGTATIYIDGSGSVDIE